MNLSSYLSKADLSGDVRPGTPLYAKISNPGSGDFRVVLVVVSSIDGDFVHVEGSPGHWDFDRGTSLLRQGFVNNGDGYLCKINFASRAVANAQDESYRFRHALRALGEVQGSGDADVESLTAAIAEVREVASRWEQKLGEIQDIGS